MNLSDWISNKRGRASQLAHWLGLRNPANPVLVYQWSKGTRPVPIERCCSIEEFTFGEVRRWDLRPDDWHRIWPELVRLPGAPAVRTEVE